MTAPMDPELMAALFGQGVFEDGGQAPPETGPEQPPEPLPENSDMPVPEGSTLPPSAESEIVPEVFATEGEGDDDRPVPDEVEYRWGSSCATCAHFLAPESCELVNGNIRPDGFCDLFEAKLGLPEDVIVGDGL